MSNNFANVHYMADRNCVGVAYIKAVLNINCDKEAVNELGMTSFMAIKELARKAFGSLPLFRTPKMANSVMTFQAWYNDLAETNCIANRLRVTGVWNEATRAAFDGMVTKHARI